MAGKFSKLSTGWAPERAEDDGINEHIVGPGSRLVRVVLAKATKRLFIEIWWNMFGSP